VTTVADVDRLVVAADGAVAHYWPRLGPKVRNAYLDDRNTWIALRTAPDKGTSAPPATLETQRRVFAGWVRAFKSVAARPRVHREAAHPTLQATQAPPPFPGPPSPTHASTAAPLPALTAIRRETSGAGAAVAGGLVLAGLIAVAARRRRA
jgi:hypothetical protein